MQIIIISIILFTISNISATDTADSNSGVGDSSNLDNLDITENTIKTNVENDNALEADDSSEVNERIINAENDDVILLEPGTYKLHNITVTKNITIQGNGNPKDVIIDGEEKSSIFLIKSSSVNVRFINLTFINGLTDNFGGAISSECGKVYVDNCIFINNTALKGTNAGAISNYGNKYEKGYLFVNNSLFINNHADHDGGAITTCQASCDIYNTVFINNTAVRDGGAIRVSVGGFGKIEDCIFMYNHADEWGGAYYSWSGTSHIDRCIFINNTAGTDGGAIMISGNFKIKNSIIMDNTAYKTGGSVFIRNPMYDEATSMVFYNNLITNNSSPYGSEISILWEHPNHLYVDFNDNDWGEKDPNDSSVIDPSGVTERSKVQSTIKSNLLNELNLDLVKRYSDILSDYTFPHERFQKSEPKIPIENTNSSNNIKHNNNNNEKKHNNNEIIDNSIENKQKQHNTVISNLSNTANTAKSNIEHGTSIGNSSSFGESSDTTDNIKAYEISKASRKTIKPTNEIKYDFLYGVLFAIVLLGLVIGYSINKNDDY